MRAPGRRPLRSSLVLAVAAILMLAAIAAAIGLGLPGIRITLDAPTSPSASTAAASSPSAAPSRSASARPTPDTGPLGSQLGLGAPVATADLRTAVTFPVRLPAAVGAPATAWLLDGRLSAVWPASPTLPPLEEPGLGLILTEFPGDVDAGYFEKVLDQGTTIEPVEVDGVVGYWISGRPHELIFVDPSGQPVFDSRRVVGESLIWARDGITYRLETGLDRAGAVKLANSLR